MPKKTFTILLSDEAAQTLEKLKGEFGQKTKGETVRLGVALLKIATDARKHGMGLSVISKDGSSERILLPA